MHKEKLGRRHAWIRCLRELVLRCVWVWCVCVWPRGAAGHGRLVEPPSRASMWRMGFPNPPDYNDNQLFCGGANVQHERHGGRCGVCGDEFGTAGEHEAGGKFANGIIGRTYRAGQAVDVIVEITANHRGWMEFHICPNDDPTKKVSEACLMSRPLAPAGGGPARVPVTADMVGPVAVTLQLPPDLTCSQCVLRWKYNADGGEYKYFVDQNNARNSWGVDPESGEACAGCGPQENFFSCADVSVGDVTPWWDSTRGINPITTTTAASTHSQWQQPVADVSPPAEHNAPVDRAPRAEPGSRPPTAEELNIAFLKRLKETAAETASKPKDYKDAIADAKNKIEKSSLQILDDDLPETRTAQDAISSLFQAAFGYSVFGPRSDVVTLPTTTRFTEADAAGEVGASTTPAPSRRPPPATHAPAAPKRGSETTPSSKKMKSIYDLDFGDMFNPRTTSPVTEKVTIRPSPEFGNFNFSELPVDKNSKDKVTAPPLILKVKNSTKLYKKKKLKKKNAKEGGGFLSSVLKGKLSWLDAVKQGSSTTDRPHTTTSAPQITSTERDTLSEIPVLYRSHRVSVENPSRVPYVSSINRASTFDNVEAVKSKEKELDSSCTLIVIGEDNGQPTYLAVCDDD